MKKLVTLLTFLLLVGAVSTKAQIFWTENFEGGSNTKIANLVLAQNKILEISTTMKIVWILKGLRFY